MLELSHASAEGVPVSMSVVAKRAGLSRPYLDQLAMSLRHAALIRTRSGRHGGYVLARPADKILLLEVVEAAIGAVSITDCIHDQSACARSEFCACRDVWLRINDRIRGVLGEYSLADLVRHETSHGWRPGGLVTSIGVAAGRAAPAVSRP